MGCRGGCCFGAGLWLKGWGSFGGTAAAKAGRDASSLLTCCPGGWWWVTLQQDPVGGGWGKRMGPNIDPQTRSCREESSLLSGRRCRASFGGGEGQGNLQVCFKAGRVELVAAPEGFAHVQPPPPPILANGCSPAQNSPRVLPAFGCVLWPTWRVPSSHLSQPCRLTGVWPQRGTGCVQQGYGRAELSCWGRGLGALEDGPGGPWGS